MPRQIDRLSAFALLSAFGILLALVTLATVPNLGSTGQQERFSSAMRGESNGEVGVGPELEDRPGVGKRTVEDI